MNWPLVIPIAEQSPVQIAEFLRRYNQFRVGNLEWKEVGLSAHQVGDLLNRAIQLLETLPHAG